MSMETTNMLQKQHGCWSNMIPHFTLIHHALLEDMNLRVLS